MAKSEGTRDHGLGGRWLIRALLSIILGIKKGPHSIMFIVLWYFFSLYVFMIIYLCDILIGEVCLR